MKSDYLSRELKETKQAGTELLHTHAHARTSLIAAGSLVGALLDAPIRCQTEVSGRSRREAGRTNQAPDGSSLRTEGRIKPPHPARLKMW